MPAPRPTLAPAMDASLSAEERACLRAASLQALRAMLAEQERRLPPSRLFGTDVLLTAPTERDQFNAWLDQLRRSGERIYASDYDRSPVMPRGKGRSRRVERVATNRLVATIKRVLVRIDPGGLG